MHILICGSIEVGIKQAQIILPLLKERIYLSNAQPVLNASMPNRYQDIYPEEPLIKSRDLKKRSAMALLDMDFFEAERAEMPHEVFEQHHILINLRAEPMRVENWRDNAHRDFVFHQNEIVVTPAGVKSGWRWHEKSKCIVITLDPDKFAHFAKTELGILLSEAQLRDTPQFIDEDITQAAIMLVEAMKSEIGSDVMFESYARIFLTKLIQKYGLQSDCDLAFNKSFTPRHYKLVLDYVENNFGQDINVDNMAATAGLSTSHFSRLFKQTLGQSPHQFLMAYRVEQFKKMLYDKDMPMIDIALSCGFSDQAHFSRLFKQIEGQSPKEWRQTQ